MMVSPTLYFYPRSPCGERLEEVEKLSRVTVISIHALLAESDQRRFGSRLHIVDFYPRSPCGERPQCRAFANGMYGFLSTLSLRRATVVIPGPAVMIPISIHALLAESDTMEMASKNRYLHFYPRSPCGERPAKKRQSETRR